MKILFLSAMVMVGATLVSCQKGADSPRGFSLPEGDAALGKAVFLKYQCLSCHTLKGVEQAGIVKNDTLSVRLGGKSTKIKTYAELVTSVINPSHKFSKGYPVAAVTQDGQSKMTIFNDVMTVTELVNLVHFLQPNYELVAFSRTNYRHHGY